MIVDFILAVFAGIGLKSFLVFFVLLAIAGLFMRPDRPWSSGLLRCVLIMTGISVLFGLFGDDCDCDF
jgi:hypothetical protein